MASLAKPDAVVPADAERPDNLYVFAPHCFFYTTPHQSPSQLQPHSATILFNPFGASFEVIVDQRRYATRAIALGSLVRRQIVAPPSGLIALFVMPESRLFPRFVSLGPERFQLLDRDALRSADADFVAMYQGRAEADQVLRAYQHVTGLLGPQCAEEDSLHRARELMQLIAENPGLSLEELAAAHRITYSWMSRLFSHSVGIPLRDYKNWLKRRKVWELLATDLSLTEIAHRAGFSDSAHLSRTYRRWFGMTPSESRRRKKVRFFAFPFDAPG
ncbi:helix-turn-helix transcriptional regulator [Halopseudomonas nanhaiensis]|uniref:helix-turn-helix domain-containing protein n=1 Tax=Halopseudomonas nanhaiensis TaxID=2830842 RepID=UPI001CBD1E0B|nr:AraC family transcriptional regulator [Halopseudomonas nanhaiensis]UAW99053.1 helix-turn-helix transcriptional regulator [Halopseudomonas nanhaiensis]